MFGKFSSAWDNGSSEKSLKNWLSPSSNLTSVQTLNPLTITGGNVHVCYGSNKTLNMPYLFSHESASWSVSSNLSIVSSGSNTITVTPSSPSSSGLGTVTATISGYSYSANVWVGKPGTVSNMTVMMGPSDNQICRNSSVTIAIGNTNHDLQGVTQYNWNFGSWSPYFTGYESGGYVLSQRANISTNSSTPSSQNIAVKAQNSCGESTLSYNKTFYVINCGSFKVAYPNPVKDILQIGFNDNFVKLPETMALFSEVTQKEVYRIDYPAIEKALEYDRNLNIDVSKMDRGVYFLHIASGKNATEVIRILIE